MNILVIDGQGGMLGSELVSEIRKKIKGVTITAVGTNIRATESMLKAGANQGATGENPAIVQSRTADIIVGPIGIVIADSLLGEVTPKMAVALGQSDAKKILLPVNKCNNIVIGVSDKTTRDIIAEAIDKIRETAEAV